MFKFSENSLKNRSGVDSRLIEIDDLAITLTLIDYGHHKHSGLRTAKIQNQLFNEGLSKCDGYDLQSKHQSGKALDFYAYVNGQVSWKSEHLMAVSVAYFQAASILEYKIRWGGLWKRNPPIYRNGVPYGWDMPHIELID